MTHVYYVSVRCFFISVFRITLSNFELQTSVLHKNRVEFRQEFNGHVPRHMTCVLHVSFMSFPFGITSLNFELGTDRFIG